MEDNFNWQDELNINKRYKKYNPFNFIRRLFCLHFYKRNGIYGRYDIWTCKDCGKNYYQDVTFGYPPVNKID